MGEQRQIVVLGATGFTGRLVVEALRDRELDFEIAGRSAEALRGIAESAALRTAPLVFDAGQPRELLDRLEPGAIVINCIGPFGLHSTKLTAALASRPGVVLDVSGEQQFVHDSMEQNQDKARVSGATLLHSCAFESFFADLLAHELLNRGDQELEDLSSFYWFGRMLTSPGTRLTMRLVDHWHTVILEDGELRPRGPGAPFELEGFELEGRKLAVFAPYPEVLFFARSFTPKNAGSHFLLTPGEARLFGRSGAADPRKKPSVDEIVAQHEKAPRREPPAKARARQQCGVAVVATRAGGSREVISFEGRDPYTLTAEVIAWATSWLLEHPDIPAGVLPPGEVFTPASGFLKELEGWSLFDSVKRYSVS